MPQPSTGRATTARAPAQTQQHTQHTHTHTHTHTHPSNPAAAAAPQYVRAASGRSTGANECVRVTTVAVRRTVGIRTSTADAQHAPCTSHSTMHDTRRQAATTSSWRCTTSARAWSTCPTVPTGVGYHNCPCAPPDGRWRPEVSGWVNGTGPQWHGTGPRWRPEVFRMGYSLSCRYHHRCAAHYSCRCMAPIASRRVVTAARCTASCARQHHRTYSLASTIPLEYPLHNAAFRPALSLSTVSVVRTRAPTTLQVMPSPSVRQPHRRHVVASCPLPSRRLHAAQCTFHAAHHLIACCIAGHACADLPRLPSSSHRALAHDGRAAPPSSVNPSFLPRVGRSAQADGAGGLVACAPARNSAL